MKIQTQNQQIEVIEKKGSIPGLTSAKSEREWITKKIKSFKKSKNFDMVKIFECFLDVHNKFHPIVKINIEGWKGKSGYNVESFPDYFEVNEWRKIDRDSEPINLKHKVDHTSIIKIINAVNKLPLNKKYKTKVVAQIWAKENNIFFNNDGKPIFNGSEFNYANISGCRPTYFDMYYPLKVLQFYDKIEYYKTGHIKRLQKDLNIHKEVE